MRTILVMPTVVLACSVHLGARYILCALQPSKNQACADYITQLRRAKRIHHRMGVGGIQVVHEKRKHIKDQPGGVALTRALASPALSVGAEVGLPQPIVHRVVQQHQAPEVGVVYSEE